MEKRIKDNQDYVKTESGAIVLDSKQRYNDYMKQREAKLKEKQEINDLRSEVDELKDLVNKLVKKKGKE